jgi:hypothetical protein
LAVGGNWPGDPNSVTKFPQDLVIDYIRIFQDLPIGIEQVQPEPDNATGLYQNFPNPFEKSTTISYALKETGHVSLEVFDASGRVVQTLVDGHRLPGSYQVSFDGSELSPGLYTCKLTSGKIIDFKRLVLLNH